LIGRVERLRATQLTASTNSVGSTKNFIFGLFLNFFHTLQTGRV
jgi:hypothetical protein